MKIYEHAPVIDTILESWRGSIAGDFAAYRNHCYRVLNFCLAFSGDSAEVMSKVSIAAAFHDLGIWTDNTWDYLAPSRQLAREFLSRSTRDEWSAEIEAMIEQHHKITRYKLNPSWLVEPFRKADWVDVSLGRRRFGLASAFVKEVLSEFPNEGFHKRLVVLTLRRLKRHPLSPLPMFKL